MGKGKDPAFLFYPNDFILGTYTMSDEQVGIYIRLLAISHTKGGKLSEREFFMINTIRDEYVTSKFILDEQGFYYNERLLEEIKARQSKKEINRENGGKGGNPNFTKGKSNPYYQKDKEKDNQTVMSSVMLKDNQEDNQKINIAFENENEDINVIKDVITYLNLKALKNYKDVESNYKFIRARLNEGYTLEDLKKVIDIKVKDWLNTKDAKYLRPETLFNATKFQGYINQQPTAEEEEYHVKTSRI